MTYLLSKNYEDKAPVFLQDPYIDGTPQVGNTLTARWFVPGYSETDPDWSVAYQWYWGATDTTLTEEEFDETGQALICTADHLTGYVSCRVAVTNPSGSVVKFAANVGPVTDYSAPSGTVVNPPQFSQAATLVGTPQAGRTLSVNYAVTEVPGVVYSYTRTWYRDEDGVDSPTPDEVISGATTTQYVPSAADVGKHIKCKVVASNLAGSAESTTTYSSEIQAADDSVPAGAVVIDAGWLASTTNGGPNGPWRLRTAGAYYLLDTDVTQAVPSSTRGAMFYVANRDITLDLNGHTLTYHSGSHDANYTTVLGQGNVGICLYLNWHNTEISIGGAAEPYNFILKNGTIIGAGTGSQGNALYGWRSYGIAVRNMRIEAAPGKDSMCLAFANAGDNARVAEITDNILIATTTTSGNRHDGPGNCKLLGGPSYFARNILIGGNAGIVCSTDSLIENNLIRQAGFVTNGYGVWLYNMGRVVIRDNVVIPTNGRGVLVNDGYSHQIYDNVLLSLEEPNAEFGDRLNACGLRVRYGYSNIQCSNNFMLGVGGTGHTGCSLLYLSQFGAGVAQSLFYGNTGYAIYYGNVTNPVDEFAKAITLESHYGPATTLIDSNEFYSNQWLVSTDGRDLYCEQSADWPLVRNTLGYATGDTAYAAWSAAVDAKLAEITFSDAVGAVVATEVAACKATISGLIGGVAIRTDKAFWYTLENSGTSYCDVMDTTYAGGADPLTYGYYVSTRTGTKNFRERVSAIVRLLNGPAQAIANQTVTVTPVVVATTHPAGDVYTTTTDATGYAELRAIRYALTRNASGGLLAAQTETHVDIAVAGVGTKRVAIGDFASLTELDLAS